MTDFDDAGATMAFTRSPLLADAIERDEIGNYLVMIEGGDLGRHVLIGADPLTVGRDASRDIVLVDKDVSRLHLLVSLQRGRVVVEDLNSTNGTFIDGQRVTRAALAVGSVLQVGSHVFKLERRGQRDVQRSEELARDLDKASKYVWSLLPPPLTDGAVQTDWAFQPCTKLGGDAFGYYQLDATTFVMYLIDVSGHGVGAAMHSVSVLNILRQRALPDVDVRNPAQVLAGLNAMFQMEQHDGMFLTVWYGVYDVGSRMLRFGCAGHHAGCLLPPDRSAVVPLKTPGLMIGASPEARYREDSVSVPAGASLYLFSDGVFEIVTRDGRPWRLADFLSFVRDAPQEGLCESQRLHRAVVSAARPGPLDDDFSLVVVTFP